MVATEIQIANAFLSKDEEEFKKAILGASAQDVDDIEEAICQTNRKLSKSLTKDARLSRIKTLENKLQWLGLLSNFMPFAEEYEGHKAIFAVTHKEITIDITTPEGKKFREVTESPAKSSLIRHFRLWVNKRLPKQVAQEKTLPSDTKVEIIAGVLSEKDKRMLVLDSLVEGDRVQSRISSRIGYYKGIQNTPMPDAWVEFEDKTYPEPTNPLDLIKIEEDAICRILAGKVTAIASPLIKDICGENNWIVLHTGHSLSSEIYQPTWKLCSHIADCSPESADLKKESGLPMEESKQSCSLRMTEMLKLSCEATTQISPSIPISAIGVPLQENSTYLQSVSPVTTLPQPETEPDSRDKLAACGSKHLGAYASESQSLLSWNSLKGLSIEDFEQCLEDCEWQNIQDSISKSYRQRKLERPTSEIDYLSLPTLTSCNGKKSRPAGQTRCEKWFRDNGILQDSQCLSASMMESLMGFPVGHTAVLQEAKELHQEELKADTDWAKQLFQDALPSPSSESNISLSCFKIPNDLEGKNLTKDEVYGLIKQLNGVVETAPEFVKYSKNFIRYALVKIDNRRGYHDFDCKNMTEFLAERYNLFCKGYSTLQKEWQAGKLEYSLGFEIGTLPETQARELYPLKDKIKECEQAYAMACSWAESENRKVRATDIRLAVRTFLNIPTIEPIKTKCGWVAGPNAARHYRVRILEAEINLHDTYTETAQELETIAKTEQTPPEQLLIEGLLGAFAQSLGTSHAGAIAAAVTYLKNQKIHSQQHESLSNSFRR